MEMQQTQPTPSQESNTKKDGFWAGLRRFWDWVIGKNHTGITPRGQTTSMVAEDNFHKPYIDYEKNLKHFDDELVIPELQQNFMANKTFMLDCGFRDGVVGIKSEHIKTIAKTHAQNLFDQANVVLKGKLDALKTEKEAKELIKERAEMHDHEQHAYKKYLEYGYRYFPRSFSKTLFVIYFICFLVLLLADIPLALRLIKSGFNLKSNGGLDTLFIGGDTWGVIKANWELFATAIGIAMCTVYIKIFYDEFIGTPFGNKLVSKQKFVDLYKSGKISQDRELTEADIKEIDEEATVKKRWKYAIVIITMLTLLFLAIFRIHTLSSYVTNPTTGAQQLQTVPTGWPLNAAIVCITLIFPIISGICLSLALTNLQNGRRFSEAKRLCTESHTTALLALTAYTKVQKECENLQSELKNWNTESRVENHAAILLAHYEYGRNHGLTEPDRFTKDKDFFEKITLWREKAIARKINNHIIPMPSI